jgi:hypothetical protein
MYKISEDPDGAVLLCHYCSHVERIDSFNESLGSRRAQAAQTMQSHSCEKHRAGSVLKSIPKSLRSHKAVVTSRTVPIPPTTVGTAHKRQGLDSHSFPDEVQPSPQARCLEMPDLQGILTKQNKQVTA